MVQDAAYRRDDACSVRLGCKEGGKIGSSREVVARRRPTSCAVETRGEGLADRGRRGPRRKMPRSAENTGDGVENGTGS